MARSAVGEQQAQPGGPARSAEGQESWEDDFATLIAAGAKEESGGRTVVREDQAKPSEPEAGEGEDGDDADGAGAAQAGEDDAAGEDGENSSEGDTEAERVSEWADVVRTKPQRLDEVPREYRAKVLTEALGRSEKAGKDSLRAAAVAAIQKASNDAYQKGLAEARARHQSDAEFEEVRELWERDGDAFAELVKTEPGKVAAFARRLDAEQNPSPRDELAGLQRQAEALGKRVEGKPVATAYLQRVYQEHGAERWAATPEGLEQLTLDVAEALAEERVTAKQAEREPARKAAEQRQTAAQRRQGLPRPGAEGPRGGGKVAPEESADWMSDLAEGFREARTKGK